MSYCRLTAFLSLYLFVWVFNIFVWFSIYWSVFLTVFLPVCLCLCMSIVCLLYGELVLVELYNYVGTLENWTGKTNCWNWLNTILLVDKAVSYFWLRAADRMCFRIVNALLTSKRILVTYRKTSFCNIIAKPDSLDS